MAGNKSIFGPSTLWAVFKWLDNKSILYTYCLGPCLIRLYKSIFRRFIFLFDRAVPGRPTVPRAGCAWAGLKLRASCRAVGLGPYGHLYPFGRFPKDAAIVNHVLEFSIYSFPKDVSVNSFEP
jgi:hypothetical protein